MYQRHQLTNASAPAPIAEDIRNPYACFDDVQVIVACQRKDKGAFKELFNRFHRFVRADIRTVAPDFDSSQEDLVQDVFLRVWRSIGTVRNPQAFRSWLHHLVINLFYDELRRRPRLAVVSLDQPINYEEEDGGLRQIADTRAQPDELAERKEVVDQVNTAIGTLSGQFRNVIVLREIEGMAYDDIAAATGAELGTVKSRIARARLKLRKQLSYLTCA